MLPNLTLLKQIRQRIQTIPNQHGEFKRKEHHGLFLLCYKAGLRVSEAVNFNLNQRTKKGLYHIKTKGKKKRYVYVPKRVISELKKCEWKPQQTNRFNFYHFLKSIKKGLEIPANTELTPHTLRRSFATHHAENGLPLPLLQKLLGHKSIRTTALYWMNIYAEDDNDGTGSILAGKQWLEKSKPSQPEPEEPIKVNLDQPPILFTPSLPTFRPAPAEHLSKINQLENQLSQIQSKNNSLKSELAQEKEKNTDLQQDLSNLSQQKAQETTEKKQLHQELTTAKETISQLEQNLITTQNNLAHEKQINQSLQETNTNLTQKNQINEQNLTNLQNAYQIALKVKELIQKQLNHLFTEIKKAAQQLQQWQKINYYQQLEQQTKMEAKIIHPPPWKKP